MRSLVFLAATVLAALSLTSCGLSPAASAGRRGGSYASGDESGGAPFLGKQ